MPSATENTDKLSIADVIIQFIQSHRRLLTIFGISIVAIIVVISVLSISTEYLRNKAISIVEDFALRIEKVNEYDDEESKLEALVTITEELKAFSINSSGFPAARSWSLLGNLYAEQKLWVEAQDAWLNSANALPKSLIAPSVLYDAAVAAEESGDNAKAIELYQRIANEYNESFVLLPRVYFAIGRLSENQGDSKAALEAYKKMVEEWPSSGWTKIANGRIIMLAETN